MNSKQFAWAYLIENGEAGQEPGYYGGYEIADKRLESLKSKSFSNDDDSEKFKKLYISEIKAYGVNWDKTEAPKSDIISKFNGTFAKSTEEEYIRGELVLMNGTKQTWVAEALEVTNVFDMMERVSESENKFKEIFR